MANYGGFGVIPKIDIAATLTAIPYARDVKLPTRELETTDSTAHDSTGGWNEQLATGRKSLGDLEIELVHDGANSVHAAIKTALTSTSSINTALVKPGTTETITCLAFVYKFKLIGAQDGAMLATWTFKYTGQPTVS